MLTGTRFELGGLLPNNEIDVAVEHLQAQDSSATAHHFEGTSKEIDRRIVGVGADRHLITEIEQSIVRRTINRPSRQRRSVWIASLGELHPRVCHRAGQGAIDLLEL